MGMAASQARLLTITARLSDNELRSQTINNAKMRLATQSSQASDSYISALNDANLLFSNYDSTGTAQSQLLTYNALTAYSSYNNQYGLVNSSGQLLVSESEAKMFDSANGNLNAYLKSHGLEYTTTYFDELGNLENPDYPSPFNIMEPATLKDMYEAYGSYQNSIEVENYEKYYQDYTSAASTLKTACKNVLKSYLTSGSNNPNLTATSNGATLPNMPTDNVGNMLNYYKNAFTTSGTTYNIYALEEKGFLTKEAREAIEQELNSFTTYEYDYYLNGGTTGPHIKRTGVKSTTPENLPATATKDESGNVTSTTYTVAGEVEITVDSNGNVTNVKIPERETGDPSYYFTKNNDGTDFDYSGKALNDVLNHFAYDAYNVEYDDSDKPISETYAGTHYFESNITDGTINLNSYTNFTDPAALKDVLESSVSSIYNYLLSDDNFSYENFAMALAAGELGITLPADSDEKKALDAYNSAKEAYLKFIFKEDPDPAVTNDSYDIINKLIRNNKITAKQMQDVDFILRLASGAVKDDDGNPLVGAGGLQLTENYNTVVKEFIIKNMIEETGEPKYAWVDENDTSNKGNADAKAQWYTNIFNRMKAGGYKAIENGLASSSEWLEFALESGLVAMEQVDKSFNWKSLDYKTCSRITESTDNSDAVAKAEAEYNRAMKDIDSKDSMYDMELKNIDTEHTALQTEYESIKGVITKNIERTFKFNQNG